MEGNFTHTARDKGPNLYLCCLGCIAVMVPIMLIGLGPIAFSFQTTLIEDAAIVDGQLQARFVIYGKGDPAAMYIATGPSLRDQRKPWRCVQSVDNMTLGNGNELTVIWASTFEPHPAIPPDRYTLKTSGPEALLCTINTLDLTPDTADLILSQPTYFVIQFTDGRAICQRISRFPAY